jgi:hypothetical protein
MKKTYIIALLSVVLAVSIPIFNFWSTAVTRAKFLKIIDGDRVLTVSQVEALVGRPSRIEQSQTADQTVTGEVYYYSIHNGAMRIVFVNGMVLHGEFVSGAKS